MLDNNTVYFLNIIWTYCTCMYYVSEINEYYYMCRHQGDDSMYQSFQNKAYDFGNGGHF